MSDPSDLTAAARSEERAPFDRDAHPALGPFFAGLDDLATPPADASVRLDHISRAAATAAAAPTAAAGELGWRTVGWRVAAVAAATAVVVGGLGADDRLPAPAQRMVSSIAEAVGVEIPDGSERSDRGNDDSSDQDGTAPGRSSTTRPDDTPRGQGDRPDTPRATPAEPGEPGEPATPAVPADPEKPEKPEKPERPEQSEQPPPTPPTPPSTPAQTAPSTVPDRPNDPPGQSDATPPSNPTAGENSGQQGGTPPAQDDRGKKSEKSPADP